MCNLRADAAVDGIKLTIRGDGCCFEGTKSVFDGQIQCFELMSPAQIECEGHAKIWECFIRVLQFRLMTLYFDGSNISL